MALEFIGLLLMSVLFCSWGIWKYSTSEVNAYNDVLLRAKLLEQRVSELEKNDKSEESYRTILLTKLEALESPKTTLPSMPATVALTATTPIPIEVIHKKTIPPRPRVTDFKKLKGQIKGLSK